MGEHGDCFSVLGVSPSADESVLKQAFRRQAMDVHPDRNPNNPKANADFRRLKKAYDEALVQRQADPAPSFLDPRAAPRGSAAKGVWSVEWGACPGCGEYVSQPSDPRNKISNVLDALISGSGGESQWLCTNCLDAAENNAHRIDES